MLDRKLVSLQYLLLGRVSKLTTSFVVVLVVIPSYYTVVAREKHVDNQLYGGTCHPQCSVHAQGILLAED